MSAGHTPGKWAITDTIRREGVCKVSAGGSGLVAIVGNGFNIGTYAADARLIAAAPEQHEAGAEIDRLSLVILSAVKADQSEQYEAVVAALLANRAALARARGETPKGETK